jgi:hypothetical protein
MQSREQKPGESKESAVIRDFINNRESTMNQFVSNSVGMAVLTLKKNYPGDIEATEAAYEKCVTELQAIKKSKETPETIQNAIGYIIARTKDANDIHDVVTLFIEGKEEQYVLPLKEVLPLVWLALNDHAKFAHHYDQEPDPLDAAKKDLPKRLEGFYHCLERVQAETVCHHGNRNELVFLLNGTYEGIELIEDARSTVLAFLKDYINKLFWERYGKSSNEEQQVFASALFEWMQTSNPSKLLAQIDAGQNHRKQIYELFERHGSNPKAIEKLVNDALTCLDFACDRKKYSFIAMTNEILNSDEESSQVARNQALPIMQEWIRQQHDLNNTQFQYRITSFYHMDKARRLLNSGNRLLLELSGRMSDELRMLEENLTPYFEKFEKNNEEKEIVIPTATYEMLQRVRELNHVIQQVKKDKMVDKVENFFAHWFGAKQESDSTRSKQLYAMFMNPLFQEKIILSDDEIERLRKSGVSQEDGITYRDITPYEVNRVFLHAILEENWSDLFLEVFKATLQFVKSNFNKPESDRQAKALKQNSYPPALISQLDYLSNKYCPQELESKQAEPPQRPEKMLILPRQIGTFSDWQWITSLINRQQHENTYHAQFNFISRILRDHWVLSRESFKAVYDSIPYSYKAVNESVLITLQQEFFLRYASLDLHDFMNKNIDNLIFILNYCPPDNRLDFLIQIKLDLSIIKNVSDLTAIFHCFPYMHQLLHFIKERDFDINRIIKTARDLLELTSVIYIYYPENPLRISTIITFVKRFNLNLADLITKEEDLIYILNCNWDLGPANSKNDFIKKLNVSALVKSTQGLKALLDAVGQYELIQLIKEKKLDLTAIIKNVGDLFVLKYLSEDNQMVFIKKIEPCLPVIISNASDLLIVFLMLCEKNRTRFIDEINLDYAAMLTTYIGDLIVILTILPAHSRIDFVRKTGVDIQNIVINTNERQNNTLSLFTPNERDDILGKFTRELNKNAFELSTSQTRQTRLKAVLVGMPLYIIGDVFFKNLFSYVLGFEWFLRFLQRFDFPVHNKMLSIPSLKYTIALSSGVVPLDKLGKYLFGQGDYPLISKISLDSVSYKMNFINFWAICLNFIAINLGKILGWILVSPFTITANLLIKAYYGVKSAILNFKINSNPQELTSLYFSNSDSFKISANKAAKHVNASDAMVGFVKYHRENIWRKIDYTAIERFEFYCRPYGYDNLLVGRYKNYSHARKKILVREYYWSLVKTILSGIFLLPLLFTIPAHNKLIKRQDDEKQLLNKNTFLIEQICQLTSQMKNNSYFEIGKLLSNHQRPDLGFYYFEKVSKFSPMYKEAMKCCGNYLLEIGQHDLANQYFKIAQEAPVVNTAQRQAPLAVVATESMPPEVKEEKSEESFVASISSSTQTLRRVGVFADQSVTRSPEINDSDDEKHEMSLSDSDNGTTLRPRA